MSCSHRPLHAHSHPKAPNIPAAPTVKPQMGEKPGRQGLNKALQMGGKLINVNTEATQKAACWFVCVFLQPNEPRFRSSQRRRDPSVPRGQSHAKCINQRLKLQITRLSKRCETVIERLTLMEMRRKTPVIQTRNDGRPTPPRQWLMGVWKKTT